MLISAAAFVKLSFDFLEAPRWWRIHLDTLTNYIVVCFVRFTFPGCNQRLRLSKQRSSSCAPFRGTRRLARLPLTKLISQSRKFVVWWKFTHIRKENKLKNFQLPLKNNSKGWNHPSYVERLFLFLFCFFQYISKIIRDIKKLL